MLYKNNSTSYVLGLVSEVSSSPIQELQNRVIFLNTILSDGEIKNF